MTQPTFGTGTGGFAQPDLWQILYGMTNINPALDLAMQQYRSQSSLAGQLASANASAQSGVNQSLASVYGSQVAAQGGIAQQNIQSGTAASIANAQISGDLIKAMGGDQNAAYRLQAQLGLQAGVANQDMQRQILTALSTTGLRSQSQANAWMRGFQPQPGFGSAGNYWLNSVNPIASPQVQYSPYDLSGLVQAQAAQGSLGALPSMPSFSTGNIGGGNVGNIGGMFSDIYGQLQNTLGPMELLFGAAPAQTGAPLAPNGFPAGSPEAIASTQSTWERLLAAYNSGAPLGGANPGPAWNPPPMPQPGDPGYFTPMPDPGAYLHAGGKIKPGETAIVGERGPEIAKGVKGGTDIIPLDKFRGGFHTGTAPHSHQEMVDAEGNPIISETNPWDVVPDVPFPNPNDPILPGERDPFGGVPIPNPYEPTWEGGIPNYPNAPTTTTYPEVEYGSPAGTRTLQASGTGIDYGALGAEGSELAHVTSGQLLQRGFSRKADGSIWHRTSAGPRVPITAQQIQRLLQLYSGAAGDTIGVPEGEEPVVEPDGLEQPPPVDPRTGEPQADLSTLLGNIDSPGFSYDPSKDLSGTGAEALGLPGIQALLGNVPQGFPGNQTFDLPELGLSGLPGPAQRSSIFRPGILTEQEIKDIGYLFQLGGYDPSTAAQIIQTFTPGRRSPFQALGF